MLVRTNDDNSTVLPVDATQVEDVLAVLKVGRVGLLIIDKPEPPLARKQNGRQLFDLEVAMSLLKYAADVDDAIDVHAFRREAPDRRRSRRREDVHKPSQLFSARIGEGVDTPGAIGPVRVSKLYGLGVGEPHHGC